MKKTVKEIIRLSAITISTLAAGFAISLVSFGLFDNLSANGMKILFAVDVLSLVGACTGVHFFLQSKRNEAKMQKESEARHNKRVKELNAKYREINEIIKNGNFAA